MLTVSNSLSLIRAPLALLFLQDNIPLRIFSIFLAMLTDSIDGYLARRNSSVSRLGTILDPAMDKFFVYFTLAVFYKENALGLFEMLILLSRDISLLLYGLFMVACGRWYTIVFRAIRWGKISTAMQFLALIGLTMHSTLPWVLYAAFIAMGLLALIELFQCNNPFSTTRSIH